MVLATPTLWQPAVKAGRGVVVRREEKKSGEVGE
jgi:hypothetical protein